MVYSKEFCFSIIELQRIEFFVQLVKRSSCMLFDGDLYH